MYANGVAGSFSNPSQPARASLCTREMSSQAAPAWISTNGLVSANPRHRERRGAAERAPPPPPGDDHRHGGDRTRILRRCGEPDREPRPFEAPLDREREHAGDGQSQQDVGDGHPRVRDVGRRDGDRRGADDRGSGAIGAAPEPPGRPHAADPERHGNEPSGAEGGCAEEGLHRREQGHQQRGVVVPTGIEMALADPPGAGDDARLVRIQNRERQPVADADEAEGCGEDEDRHEGDPSVRWSAGHGGTRGWGPARCASCPSRSTPRQPALLQIEPNTLLGACPPRHAPPYPADHHTSGTVSPTSDSTSLPETITASTPARSSSRTSARLAPASSAIASLPAGMSGSSSRSRSR